MVSWNNFDKLNAYKTLQGLKSQIELKKVMAGEEIGTLVHS